MNKEEFIRRRGEAAYEKMEQQNRGWRTANPGKVIAHNQEGNRKGGKYYERHLVDNRTGLQGERKKIRTKHAKQYHPFKNIMALNSQIHHEWIPGTAKYRGVALVETRPHRYGIIDVIKVLEGKITLLTEKEILEQGVV